MAMLRTPFSTGGIGGKKEIPASLYPIQRKMLFVYVRRKSVLDILETQAPFPPPPTHTPGKAWGEHESCLCPFLSPGQ